LAYEAKELPPPEPLPRDLEGPRLRRRVLQVMALLVVVGLVAWLAPGLGEVRARLSSADPVWLAVGVVLELFSCLSYVLMFKPVFCPRMTWRSSFELGMSELAVGSIVPASGAGGLALGAWALSKGGMPGVEIARRSVAFFVIKSSVNFVAVIVVGVAMFLGVGPSTPVWLTLGPAVLALVVLAAVPLIGLLGHPERPRWLALAVSSLGDGVREAGRVVKRHDWRVIAGAIGYWIFDNAVIWACFKAFGESPAITLVMMGYLIGQLGGLLPLPGGIGGIDGGLIGTMIVYGLPAAAVAASVLAYRVILFWLPLLLGSVAFASLRKNLNNPDRPDLCDPLGRPIPA
jgi:uncharacterized membrane protein YbhN (UPF0104 family)